VSERPELLALSAHTADTLERVAALHAAWLEEHDAPWPDVCFTAGARRAHHDHRLALVAATREEAAQRLRAFADGAEELAAGRASHGRTSRLAFVCSGHGPQWPGMAAGLLRSEDVFLDAIERCAEALRDVTDWDLLDQLTAPDARLHDPHVAQPAMFAVQVALAALWRSWGVVPDAVVGHSMGEIAAAHVAGALTLDDAATIICRRSRLLKTISGRGAMAVVGLSIGEAREALIGYEDRLSIAVSNSPKSTVLSGDAAALNAVLSDLDERGVFCRPVNVEVASHSPQVDCLHESLLSALASVRFQPGTIPMHSTVTGALFRGRRKASGRRRDHVYRDQPAPDAAERYPTNPTPSWQSRRGAGLLAQRRSRPRRDARRGGGALRERNRA
jgi:acyl transferase domain-containing protein